jgi:hypothetical protein
MIKPLSETAPPEAASYGASAQDFWNLLDTRLRTRSENQLESKAAELFQLRQRLLGNPILDLSRILQAMGLDENSLPSPYREAMEIGDSRTAAQFLESLSSARRPRLSASDSSALEKVYDQLVSAIFEAAFY